MTVRIDDIDPAYVDADCLVADVVRVAVAETRVERLCILREKLLNSSQALDLEYVRLLDDDLSVQTLAGPIR